ncbi:MAG: hypothetical protein L0Z46_10310 [Nitrospiraceae bacterium]|nr:hypothetical protein [Nitrospiraceae bacterium]
MTKVIRISESIFQRLQKLAVPLVDNPASVIDRLLDYHDSHEDGAIKQSDRQVESRSLDDVRRPLFAKDPSNRASRQRGVVVEIQGRTFTADSLSDLYSQVLKFLSDNGHIEKLKRHLPVATSTQRYLIATDPVHPNGKKFVVPVEYKGHYMEAHKDYKNGVNHLRKMLTLCGLSLDYLG